MPKGVMIVAGESSGELYGALLAAELKRRWPGLRVAGVGGERMRREGVEMVAGITSAFGVVEALSALRAVREAFLKTVAALRALKPQVVVLIDYPDFNFRVAREAKALGIKVLYYVSPQLWAWRRGRLETMTRTTDKVAVILPFEEDIYRGVGHPCEFVGHPAWDELTAHPASKREAKSALGLEDRPYVAVLPGSRRNELLRLLPVLIEFAGMFSARFSECGLVLPLAPNLNRDEYGESFDRLESLGVRITREGALLALAASEAAVAASGTVTLQATLVGTPTVVIYKVSPLTYMIGRLLVHVRFVSLTNIILGREALPELLQGNANAGRIMRLIEAFYTDGEDRRRVIDDMSQVRRLFEGRSASARTAEIVGELAGWRA